MEGIFSSQNQYQPPPLHEVSCEELYRKVLEHPASEADIKFFLEYLNTIGPKELVDGLYVYVCYNKQKPDEFIPDLKKIIENNAERFGYTPSFLNERLDNASVTVTLQAKIQVSTWKIKALRVSIRKFKRMNWALLFYYIGIAVVLILPSYKFKKIVNLTTRNVKKITELAAYRFKKTTEQQLVK